jgi:DMSO/TMAO reductase YedYZ molybdopterin-dependent catalytic subunit
MVPGVYRATAAACGVVAAGVALAVGELVASFDPSGVSLVTAVGDEFIDRFAASLKDMAVRLFGTNDKVALVVGIVVMALLVGAGVGLAGRRHPSVGPAAFAGFGVLGFAAYRRAPLVDESIGAVAAGLAAASGTGALVLLHRLTRPVSASPVDDGVSGGPGSVAPPPLARMGGPDRRRFLTAVGGLTVGAAGMAMVARRSHGPDPSVTAARAVSLPRPGRATAGPTSQPFAEPGLSPYVTPTDDFYRIDTALSIPRVPVDAWRLDVAGRVDRPFSLAYDDLLALPSIELPVTLQCVSNEVGGDLVGNAVWQGVPLDALLERAGVQSGGTQVVGRSVDGWSAGFPTELVGDGRTAIVAYAMNGEVLPSRHGFPARLIVAGLYGYVSATKWLSMIELTRLDEVDGYWIPRGWAKDGPVKTASRIDVPRAGASLADAGVVIAGVAWAPTQGIAAVEVQVDDGPWMPADLGNATSDETWVQWRTVWHGPTGDHVARVRATPISGAVQTDEIRPPAPDGATGLHARRFHTRTDTTQGETNP